MTLLDPNARPSFDSVLQSSRGVLFPESFYSFLHNYISSINELRTPSPFAGRIEASRSEPSIRKDSSSKALPSDSDHRLERIWNEFDSVESYLFLLSDEAVATDDERDPRIEFRVSGRHIGKPFAVREDLTGHNNSDICSLGRPSRRSASCKSRSSSSWCWSNPE
jgi:phosphoinositide-3-kinase, regulatory subunit 4